MNHLTNQEIEKKALDLLKEKDCLRAPLPIELLAHRLDLKVEPASLGDDISGLLVVSDEAATIGYNESQSHVRQRFTIAHEIGHYILHLEKDKDSLFIDKEYSSSFMRDSSSSTGSNLNEIQANRFAAALLMPEVLIKSELEHIKFDLSEGEALSQLASKFEVSVQAMSIRLGSLGIFTSN